ncbi:cell division protein ZapD [Utexia brackfieldae]|uniref:cell division protein ZapD n=1 Tax=Utexia brackfieldae TaxID=3074108 RepID=UPI00370D41D1
MTEPVAKIVFEHPLNEKMRIWLRIEFLLKQIYKHKIFDQHNALLFFHSLGELLEIIERNDIRGELLKELDIQKQKLTAWVHVDGVDTALLRSLLDRLSSLSVELNTNPRIGLALKEDKFISSIRQRLMIPGGCCSFDLPLFHLWLSLPQAERDTQVMNWIGHISSVNDILTICIQLIRQLGLFRQCQCLNNFYQNNNEDAELLRIRIPQMLRIYPQVSGHKSRYAVRFLSLENSHKNQHDNFEFELACC